MDANIKVTIFILGVFLFADNFISFVKFDIERIIFSKPNTLFNQFEN